MSRASRSGANELRTARRLGAPILFSVFVFSVFVNLLMLTGPLFMLQVYDRVLTSRSEETLVALVILIAGLFALMAVLDFARSAVMTRAGARLRQRLDARVLEADLRSGQMRDKPDAPAGPAEVDALQTLYASPVLMAVMDIPWTPVFLAAIFVFHPMLGWLAVAGGSVLILVALLNQLTTRRGIQETSLALKSAGDFATRAKDQSEAILAQGMGKAVVNRFEAMRDIAGVSGTRASTRRAGFSSFTKSARQFLQSAMLAVGAYFVLLGEMTPGAMIAASILLGRALAPVETAIGQWAVVQRARAAWRALAELLSAVPEGAVRTSLPRPKGHLSVRSLTLIPPGTKKAVLRNVIFDIAPGEALGVIGRSGAGKSTLARALLGVWQPTTGEVRLGGATIDQYDPSEFGRHVGYLPQSVALLPGTVAEIIARMETPVNAERVVAAAMRSNAHEMILGLSNGYDTRIENDQMQLSGGQKQRIALARALYSDPVLLVLDEPNSALDSEGTDALNRTLRELKAAGSAVVIMTHRPMALSECDRLLVLDGGAVTAIGPRDEVLGAMLKNSDKVKQAIKAEQQR